MASRPATAAYQGEPGAYSEEAAARFLAGLASPRRLEGVPCLDFLEVCEAVERGRAEFGVLPVENSLQGNIDEATDALAEVDLAVVGEVLLPIRHALVGRPGAKLKEVKRAHSHPQALKQCGPFLRRQGLLAMPRLDTAEAVRWLAERGTRADAAVASERAAKLHGMHVLARDIAAEVDNTTRFLLIAPDGEGVPRRRKGVAYKTSIVFGTRNVPGALHRCMGELASRHVNMTKLESRPRRGKPWRYVFFLDLDGHVEDPRVADAVDALARRASWFKLLGTYPAAVQGSRPRNGV